MKASTLILLCGLCLTSGISAQVFFSSSDLQFQSVPRFSRLLRQDLGGIVSYLLPKEPALSELCTQGDCCQSDSYASPYSLFYRNHTQRDIGGRHYSTFFYTLSGQHSCNTNLDNKQCCVASVDTIWVDVDPTLKVKYVEVDGVSDIVTQQNDFGLKIGNINYQLAQVASSSSDIMVKITVEGYTDQLCPPPGLAPVSGICEVIVAGGSPSGASACCPYSITNNATTPFIPGPNDGFTCNSDLSRYGQRLQLDTVSSVFEDNGRHYVTYNFLLRTNPTCTTGESVTDCCDATLQYLELKITDQVISKTTVNGVTVPHRISLLNEPGQTSYRSLIIEQLDLDNAKIDEDDGIPVSVTLSVPSLNAMVPDLCDASNDPFIGACTYYLHSDDGLCCPAGAAVFNGTVPPPPPGTCAPMQAVQTSDTSMQLQYLEYSQTPTNNTYTFMVANHNSQGTCTKPYCRDVCSWTLYVRNDALTSLVVMHEDVINDGRLLLTPGVNGAPAQLTFPYGPVGESTTNYQVTVPASFGRSLAALCAPGALPGQGVKDCAAIVRAEDVFIMVYFDDEDVLVAPPTSPPGPTPSPTTPPVGMCEAPLPMASACYAASKALFNPQAASTSFSFSTAVALSTSGCTRPSPANQLATLRLYISSGAVDQLTTSKKILPPGSLTLNRNSGASWIVAQADPVTFKFNLAGRLGVSDLCRQGVAPDQPAGTCAVEVLGTERCYRGYLQPTADGSLVWSDSVKAPGSRGVGASTIVPAVVIPVVALLVALVIVALVYRRRRRQQYETAGGLEGSEDGLEQPLTAAGGAGGSVAGSLTRDDLSVPSVSPSDVQIRVPGPSAGGAIPVAGLH